MKLKPNSQFWRIALVVAICAVPMLAQGTTGGPWGNAVATLRQFMTGPVAYGGSLIAIVMVGLGVAMAEHGASQRVVGVVVGVGLALGAISAINWLFPGASSVGN